MGFSSAGEAKERSSLGRAAQEVKKRWIIGPLVVIGAFVLAVAGTSSRSPNPPRLEIEFLAWTTNGEGRPAAAFLITNASRWVVNRHVPYSLWLDDLGDRLETLPMARSLLPGEVEQVVIDAPDAVTRWRVEVRFTAWETGWQWKMRHWRAAWGGFGFAARPRSPAPGTLQSGTVTGDWITNPPAASPSGVSPHH